MLRNTSFPHFPCSAPAYKEERVVSFHALCQRIWDGARTGEVAAYLLVGSDPPSAQHLMGENFPGDEHPGENTWCKGNVCDLERVGNQPE